MAQGRPRAYSGSPTSLGETMYKSCTLAVLIALAGCGVETASTAATAAAIKKQEVEQGQKTMQQAQERIDGAVQQMQQRAGGADR